MGNRVCKSLPRLVFSFTAKKIEVQFSQALYKVDQKKGGVLFKIRLLRGMCETADSCVQKVSPGQSFDRPRKKCRAILRTPCMVWIMKSRVGRRGSPVKSREAGVPRKKSGGGGAP